MNFVGTGKRLAQGDIGDAARTLGIETAVLLAFLEVEAAGRGFDSKNRPKMLFEPHVFWRNLTGTVREAAARMGLAYAKWKRDYPADSYPRLQQAITLAREPAFRSASYGLPQILGENHKAAGFASAESMFVAMKRSEREQLFAMVRLLQAWGLAVELVDKNFTLADSWRPAAQKYNGKGYAENGYHLRLAEAYAKHKGIKPLPPKVPVPANATMLETGMKGEAVRALQADLQALGFIFNSGIDGRFGAETEANVRLFQAGHGLTIDGKAGPMTLKAIASVLAAKGDETMPPAGPPVSPKPQTPGAALAVVIAGFIAAVYAYLKSKGLVP